jgi:hypothetical protein
MKRLDHSYSPEFLHGRPDANIKLELVNLAQSARAGPMGLNYERIEARASLEMAGLAEMQEKLQADFDFSCLQQVLGSIVNSQANHNKHLVYLLNKQLTKTNVLYLSATENNQAIERFRESLGNIQYQLTFVKDEIITRDNEFEQLKTGVSSLVAARERMRTDL